MGKHRSATKAGGGAHKDASPTLSSHGGKQGDTAQDLMEEVASQMGKSPKMPFRFTQLSRLSYVCSLSLEHWLVCSTTPMIQMCYCIHIRVTLEKGKGRSPPPSHTWSGPLIANILQEAWQLNHWGYGHGARGGSPVFWKVLTQGGVPL